MEGGTSGQSSPRGLRRLALRLPILLYHIGLGGIFGARFLLLTHTGRTSGKSRQTVLEVVQHDPTEGVYVVASGWGERAHWFQNILHQPAVTIQVGRRVMFATATRLPVADAATRLASYAQRHPSAFRTLTRMLMGTAITPHPDDCARLAARVPLVALTYRDRMEDA